MVVLVTGAGGAIGGHLVNALVEQGYEVRAVDIKPREEWWQGHPDAHKYPNIDLSLAESCSEFTYGVEQIYHLACEMGGIEFIENNKTACNFSSLIDLHLVRSSIQNGVTRIFHSSSACVYNAKKQNKTGMRALKETDAYPALCEDGYGWAKLACERLLLNAEEEGFLEARIARYHNVYGPHCTWAGGREKAPAAIVRKTIEAKLSGNHEIEIWGDGEQERSFMYMDDCVVGSQMIMDGPYSDPVNLGSSELVSINELASIAEDIAGIKLMRIYDLTAPQGVRGRNSDNTLIKKRYDWEPSISLRYGMEKLYEWIWNEMNK